MGKSGAVGKKLRSKVPIVQSSDGRVHSRATLKKVTLCHVSASKPVVNALTCINRCVVGHADVSHKGQRLGN